MMTAKRKPTTREEGDPPLKSEIKPQIKPRINEDTPLTPKHLRFIEEYVKDLNGTAAYKRAGYKVANDNVAAVEACHLLRLVKISNAVAAALAKQAKRAEITADLVIEKLRENAENAANDSPPNRNEVRQSWVAIGKHLFGMWPDKVDHRFGGTGIPIEVNGSVDLTTLPLDVLRMLAGRKQPLLLEAPKVVEEIGKDAACKPLSEEAKNES